MRWIRCPFPGQSIKSTLAYIDETLYFDGFICRKCKICIYFSGVKKGYEIGFGFNEPYKPLSEEKRIIPDAKQLSRFLIEDIIGCVH